MPSYYEVYIHYGSKVREQYHFLGLLCLISPWAAFPDKILICPVCPHNLSSPFAYIVVSFLFSGKSHSSFCATWSYLADEAVSVYIQGLHFFLSPKMESKDTSKMEFPKARHSWKNPHIFYTMT